MYNSFTAGTKAEPEKYNNELRSVSQKFKEAGVQAVILDVTTPVVHWIVFSY